MSFLLLLILNWSAFALEFDADPPLVLQVHSAELDDENGYWNLYAFDESGRHRVHLIKYENGYSVHLWTARGHVVDDRLSAEDYGILRRQLEHLPRNSRPNAGTDDAPALATPCPARIEFELGEKSESDHYAPAKIKAIRQICREY